MLFHGRSRDGKPCTPRQAQAELPRTSGSKEGERAMRHFFVPSPEMTASRVTSSCSQFREYRVIVMVRQQHSDPRTTALTATCGKMLSEFNATKRAHDE